MWYNSEVELVMSTVGVVTPKLIQLVLLCSMYLVKWTTPMKEAWLL